MLKQPFICWAIRTTKSEKDWSYDELFDTAEEAVAASENYYDWYGHSGDCQIDRLRIGGEKVYEVLERLWLKGGYVISHKNLTVKKG